MNLLREFYAALDRACSAFCSKEQPVPPAPSMHPHCVHGVERPDCEVSCAACSHPCRGHDGETGGCSATWGEQDKNYPYQERYKQRYCDCPRFQ